MTVARANAIAQIHTTTQSYSVAWLYVSMRWQATCQVITQAMRGRWLFAATRKVYVDDGSCKGVQQTWVKIGEGEPAGGFNVWLVPGHSPPPTAKPGASSDKKGFISPFWCVPTTQKGAIAANMEIVLEGNCLMGYTFKLPHMVNTKALKAGDFLYVAPHCNDQKGKKRKAAA